MLTIEGHTVRQQPCTSITASLPAASTVTEHLATTGDSGQGKAGGESEGVVVVMVVVMVV